MTDDDQSDDGIETREHIHSGVSIKGEAKMGSGTRDQSKVVIKGKGRDAEEAASEFEEGLQAAEDGDWGHRLLQLNPERSDDEDDE